MSTGIFIIVCCWCVLNFVFQAFPSLYRHIKNIDRLRVLPNIVFNWKFFAPNPEQRDLVVLRADVFKEEDKITYSDNWSVSSMAFDSKWYYIFFNPTNRLRKAIHSLKNNILIFAENYDVEEICKSAQAQAFFRFISHQENSRNNISAWSDWQRFAIVSIQNARSAAEGELLFITNPMKIKDS